MLTENAVCVFDNSDMTAFGICMLSQAYKMALEMCQKTFLQHRTGGVLGVNVGLDVAVYSETGYDLNLHSSNND